MGPKGEPDIKTNWSTDCRPQPNSNRISLRTVELRSCCRWRIVEHLTVLYPFVMLYRRVRCKGDRKRPIVYGKVFPGSSRIIRRRLSVRTHRTFSTRNAHNNYPVIWRCSYKYTETSFYGGWYFKTHIDQTLLVALMHCNVKKFRLQLWRCEVAQDCVYSDDLQHNSWPVEWPLTASVQLSYFRMKTTMSILL
jgi:hypothetical protein